jgi:hypothetical protein
MISSVRTIRPTNYPHNCFAEIEESLSNSIKDLELKGGGQLILGAALEPRGKYNDNDVIFNLEQAGNNWFTHDYINLLETHEVWDYDLTNIQNLKKIYNINAKYCGIGYHKCLDKICKSASKDIDILFYGSENLRRSWILDTLSKKYRVGRAFQLYGNERDAAIGRSKIVINIHYYNRTSIFEIIRCSYLLSNSICVVSETGTSTDTETKLKDAIKFAEYQDLEKTCEYLLENNSWQLQATNGYNIFRKIKQVDYLKEALK